MLGFEHEFRLPSSFTVSGPSPYKHSNDLLSGIGFLSWSMTLFGRMILVCIFEAFVFGKG